MDTSLVMRQVLRSVLYMLLIGIVTITSMQLAAARGQSRAVATLVICTGSGPVHMLVDETGAPSGGVMICPDYALAFFAPLDVTAGTRTLDKTWRSLWQITTGGLVETRPTPLAQPRGPPAFF